MGIGWQLPIGPLACEPPYAMGAALKSKEKKKKRIFRRLWTEIIENKTLPIRGKTIDNYSLFSVSDDFSTSVNNKSNNSYWDSPCFRQYSETGARSLRSSKRLCPHGVYILVEETISRAHIN